MTSCMKWHQISRMTSGHWHSTKRKLLVEIKKNYNICVSFYCMVKMRLSIESKYVFCFKINMENPETSLWRRAYSHEWRHNAPSFVPNSGIRASKLKPESRGLAISRDLASWRLTAYWIRGSGVNDRGLVLICLQAINLWTRWELDSSKNEVFFKTSINARLQLITNPKEKLSINIS